MLINRKYMTSKVVALISVAAIGLTSCVQLGEDQDAAYGYLTISGLDLDVQVEQLVPTKAGDSTMDISDLIGENRPELSEVTVTPEQPQEGEPAFYTWTISDGDLRLPAGKYTLSATSGSNDFGTPYFVGSGEVTVSALATAEGTVTFTLGNSVMKVTMAEGFNDHFEPEGDTPVTISGSSGNIAAAMDTYVFVPSGEQLTVKIDGRSSAGVEKDFTVTLTPEANTAYNITLSATGITLPSITLPEQQVAWCDRIFITNSANFTGTGSISDANKAELVYEAIPATSSDWSSPSLKTASALNGVITGLTSGTEYKVRARVGNLTSNEISLTPSVIELASAAEHTKTGNDLDGTDVTTTFTSPAQVVTDAISGWTFQLYNSDETELLREYTDTDGSVTSDGSLITATDGWPYLPQGTYKLKATATLTDGSIVSETYIEVGAPEFFTPTVSLGNTSYTSYDKYAAKNGITQCINGDTNVGTTMGANNCQPETLYYPSAVIGGISENLIKNSNYVKKISFLVDGNIKSSYEKGAMTSNSQTGDDVTSLSWGSHTLTATFEFDGKSVTSKSKTHHITGLPYTSPDFTKGTPSFTSSNEVEKWIAQGTTEQWNGKGYQIYYYYYYVFGTTKKSGSILSPALQLPDKVDVPINYTVGINYFSSIHEANADMNIYTGATTSQDKKTTKATPGTYSNDSITTIEGSDVAYNNTRISISHNDAKLNSNAAENWVLVTYLNIEYSSGS